MTATLPPPPDASALAAEVRKLALLAHRLLNDPGSPPESLLDLSRRARCLRRSVASRSDLDVADWLDRLVERLSSRS